MRNELEYFDDIADQNAFSGGEGGFKNGMRASPIRRRRSRKSQPLHRRADEDVWPADTNPLHFRSIT